ncbi:hypothetical protein SAMN00777080_0263 [Aquiflexum balticum DSM 16537]|uniref:Lipocalin-like domain-containing protein n=1 Tax=Aquiflexum balticum DSM 16537 TaxID=758820 RepID=A0A1W2GYK3_9BACT|nr:hypothetical protein [Aquiflexum balticum]SMD41733.1 hypothetical protein SAMN00777080_0263 [Aquiflexum balticum DSM 16537]
MDFVLIGYGINIKKNSVFWALGLVVSVSLLSCGQKEKNPLLGNWYAFEQDSTYYELYVNDTLIVLNNDNIGPIGYDYMIKENMLYISNDAGMERIWKMNEISDNYFIIEDRLESIKYYRLDLPIDFFLSIQDSVSYAEFKMGFGSRFEDNTVIQ